MAYTGRGFPTTVQASAIRGLTATRVPFAASDGSLTDDAELRFQGGDQLEILYLLVNDGGDVEFGTTTGTKLGTAATEKIALWGATPDVQPAAVADAAGGAIVDAEARTAINTLLARLRSRGVIAT